MKQFAFIAVMVCAAAASACTEKISTAPDLGFLQVDPRTVEVLIPFEDFVDSIQVFGGYGSAFDLGRGIVADDFDGLNARTLAGFGVYPRRAEEVLGRLIYSDGRVVLFFDTLRLTTDSGVDVELFSFQEDWHAPTVTWDLLIDTLGDQRPWSGPPGGGVTTLLGGATFDPTPGDPLEGEEPRLTDSVSIAIDSATVAMLGDSLGSPLPASLLVAGAEPGAFLHLVDVRLRITTIASSASDSVFEVTPTTTALSFIYDPTPTAPLGWLRVGGTPSWRSVLTMSIPRTITGTPEVCDTVGCEVDLTGVNLNLAELVLTSRQTEPGFQPDDTTRVDIRSVLNPELLPKSPLGGLVVPFPTSVPPELFSVQTGTPVAIAMTALVRELLAITAATDTVPAASIAVFSIAEPNMFGFTSFEGGGGAGAPALRLLYTIANEVGLP